jgi:hypothetical protein
MMMDWIGILIAGVTLVLFALGYRFVWPLVKDHWLVKKALEFVYQMEETYGGGTGAIKFDKAVALLKSWVHALGWKIDVTAIINAITAAVGALHAEQGKVPETTPAEVNEE